VPKLLRRSPHRRITLSPGDWRLQPGDNVYMTVLGIVGPMGSGKTHVLEALGRLGAVTIKADDLSRELLKPGAALLEELRRVFGSRYFDDLGRLRRSELATVIFADESARRRLNEVMYPEMMRLIRARLSGLRNDVSVGLVAIEAANLYEMGAATEVDYVLEVTASRRVREERIQKRDGLSIEETRRRLDAHAAAGLDENEADFTIDTEQAAAELEARLAMLYEQLTRCGD